MVIGRAQVIEANINTTDLKALQSLLPALLSLDTRPSKTGDGKSQGNEANHYFLQELFIYDSFNLYRLLNSIYSDLLLLIPASEM